MVPGHALPPDLLSGWSVLWLLVPTVAHCGKVSDQVALLASCVESIAGGLSDIIVPCTATVAFFAASPTSALRQDSINLTGRQFLCSIHLGASRRGITDVDQYVESGNEPSNGLIIFLSSVH